jgi:hypothetical protein
MNAATANPRRVAVETLSARAELLLVVRASMAISVAVWIYLASAPGIDGRLPRQRNLLPFQKLVADRPSSEQRVFRELQEGVLEAEAARSAGRSWPAPGALGADGVPPFAADPTRRASYDWALRQAGTTINYLGIPQSGDGPAWLVLMQEPEPGIPPDQTFEDEEHHRLADGSMLHVSTWVLPDGARAGTRLIRMPQAEGWLQLYAVGPSSAPSAAPVSNRSSPGGR